MVSPGYFGRTLGAADMDQVVSALRDGLRAAHRRARASGEMKARAREKFPGLGESLARSAHAASRRRAIAR